MAILVSSELAITMPSNRARIILPENTVGSARLRPTLAAMLALVLLCLPQKSLLAQEAQRDYAITTPLVSYSADASAAIVSFTITNLGSDAREESQVTIAENRSGRIETTVPLRALVAGESLPFTAELPLADFAAGDIFMKVEVGIDQYEVAGSAIARNNSQLFRINIDEARQAITVPTPESPRYDLWIPIFNLGVDFAADGLLINNSPIATAQIVLVLALALLAVFLLWIIALILRLALRRPPAFDVWQAPYAVNSFFDPDSTQGRRQSWQFHAQNSAIQTPCVENQAIAIKRLVDREGNLLDSWTIKALRTLQYDVYGRISETETVLPLAIVKRLNDLARQKSDLDNQQLNKALQPIASRISKAALRPVEKQNRMLPLALEIRFDGAPGESRILFELFQCRNGAWHMLDQWEPELMSTGGGIQENYTYALNGMLPGETYREFKQRLPQDLVYVLGGMFYHHQTDAAADGASIPDPLAADEETDAPPAGSPG